MNERIKELAVQAEKYADDNFRGEPTWSEAFESKFAELIVRECMKVNSKELSITAIERLLPLYKEHFGVEL